MNETIFEQVMGNSPRTKALGYLIKWHEWDLTVSDLAKGARITRVSAKKIIEDLKKAKMVKETRNIGPAKCFIMDQKNPIVKELKKLFKLIVSYDN